MRCSQCHAESDETVCLACYEASQARIRELETQLRYQRAWARSFNNARLALGAQLLRLNKTSPPKHLTTK